MAEAVKVRIGIQGARELEIEVADADALRTDVEKALSDGAAVVWLTDIKGNRFGLVTEKLAFLQVDEGSDRVGLGFGQ